jgi:U3 small nucleolar ribonucleoprotein protein IMP4
MLITTSRKPSQRTRTFCRSLERVLKVRCVNRGKMNIREVFLKAKEMGYQRVAIISEKNGNPSVIDVYRESEPLISLKVTVDLSLPRGRMKKDQNRLRCDRDDLKHQAGVLFGIPEENTQDRSESNLIWIKNEKNGDRAVFEFYDRDAKPISPRIYLQDWKLLGDDDESSKTGGNTAGN